MAGTLNLSMSQQFDMDGEPLSGGLLYFFAAGTSTPQSAFQDFALTITHPNPITLDASGRVPQFFLADGFIKIRLADKNGVTVIAADQLLVIGPSLGGSAGGGVDPNSVMQTGDIKARYGQGSLTGFVRCNGRTIGNDASGANELASTNLARTLFEYLWQFSNITLNTTKGANASADFDAARQLFLPDLRGRTIAGMDDMGSSAINRLTAAFFGASGIVLGNAGGNEKHTMTVAEMVQHNHGISDPTHGHGISDPTHAHGYTDPTHSHGYSDDGLTGGAPIGAGAPQISAVTTTARTTAASAVGISISAAGTGVAVIAAGTGVSVQNTGSSSPFAIASPAMVLTFYIRL